MDVQLSIIIPVYNVEKYLNRCIESIMNQSFCDYEIILVNDGSTDNSLSICNSYKNNRVIIIDKKNGGLSSARNAGMSVATGKYIMFLDSDDYIIEGCLEKFNAIMQKYEADIIVGRSRYVYEDGSFFESKSLLKEQLYSSDDYIDLLNDSRIYYTSCAPYMIYKNDFIKHNNLKFYIGILHEDELWTPQALISANTVYYSGILFYCHCVRSNSITQTRNNNKKGEDLFIVCQELLKIPGFQDSKKNLVFKDQWAMLFLQSVAMVDSCQKLITRFPRYYPFKFACKRKTKIKSFLYLVSPRLYIFLRNFKKGF